MCLIITKFAGIEVEPELIKQAWEDNKDGWGVARSIGGELVIDKGMNGSDFVKYVSDIPKEQAAIIHTRIGTMGGKEIYNCHPFLISRDFCMMHNGGITVDRPFKEMSDTWTFAFNILRPMLERNPDIYNDVCFERLVGEAVETRNKVVMMNRQGKIVIINRKQGVEYKGLWLSNNRSTYGNCWPSKTTPYTGPTHYNQNTVTAIEEFYG